MKHYTNPKYLKGIILSLCFVFTGAVAYSVDNFESVKVLKQDLPAYPLHLSDEGITKGYVKLIISINSEGLTDDVFVVEESHPEFGKIAERYARKWLFQPAKLNGEPLTVVKPIEFVFEDKTGVFTIGIHSGIPFIRDIVYNKGRKRVHNPSELDSIPIPVNFESPKYPLVFKGKNITGKATILFYIDEEGAVRLPYVTDYTHSEFAELAMMAVENWKFEPPMVKGSPVAILVEQSFEFSPNNALAQTLVK